MLGKKFTYDNKEWIVEKFTMHGHRCVCRSCLGEITQFYFDFIQEEVINYEDTQKQRHNSNRIK